MVRPANKRSRRAGTGFRASRSMQPSSEADRAPAQTPRGRPSRSQSVRARGTSRAPAPPRALLVRVVGAIAPAEHVLPGLVPALGERREEGHAFLESVDRLEYAAQVAVRLGGLEHPKRLALKALGLGQEVAGFGHRFDLGRLHQRRWEVSPSVASNRGLGNPMKRRDLTIRGL